MIVLDIYWIGGIISLLTSILVVALIPWLKMGKEGRFFMRQNFGKGGAILLELTNTGQAILHAVKHHGRSFTSRNHRFFFIPEAIPESLVEGDEKKEKFRNLNEFIKPRAWIAGKPFYVGTSMASIAAPPQLNDAVERAKRESVIKKFETWWGDFKEIFVNPNPHFKKINFLVPFSLDALHEWVNISFTEEDVDEAFRDGIEYGRIETGRENKLLMMVVIIAFISIVAVVFVLGRGG